MKNSKEVYAACALITNKNGEILAVSRKDNPNDFGLPGGKLEPGETPCEAVVRETLEETGYHVKIVDFVYSGIVIGKVADTYYCEILPLPREPLAETETGVVKFVSPKVLTNKKTAKFWSYNRRVLRTIRFNLLPSVVRRMFALFMICGLATLMGSFAGAAVVGLSKVFVLKSILSALGITLFFTLLNLYYDHKEGLTNKEYFYKNNIRAMMKEYIK